MKTTTKRIISGILTIIVIFSMIPVSVFCVSAETTVSGTCGENAKWSYDKNTATLSIFGSGAILDYSNKYGRTTAPWKDFSDVIKFVKVDKGITRIGDSAFTNCQSIIELIIPNSVIEVGKDSISYCGELTSITIPGGVKSIGNSAFAGCSKLKSVFFALGVESIGSCAFQDCVKLSEITMPDSLLFVYDYAFSNCGNLKKLIVAEGSKSITSSMIVCNDQLEEIVIPNSVRTIDNGAFFGCKKLAYNTYDNAKYIGNKNNPYYILLEATSKEIVNCDINNETRIIYGDAFNNCTKLLDIVIPDNVMSIGCYAFSGCKKLAYNIYDNAKYIGSKNNPYCVLLEATSSEIVSCDINTETRIICDYAFANCTQLTEINIPKSVINLNAYSFINCSNLASINVAYDNSIYHSVDNCLIETDAKALVVGCKTSVIPTGGSVTSIRKWAFAYCNDLSTIVIPKDIDYIYNFDFVGCVDIESVIIQDGVKIIGHYAFWNCDKLQNIIIPDSVTAIGNGVFDHFDGTIWIEHDFPPIRYIGGHNSNPLAVQNENLTIYCNKNSTAEKYANSNKIKVQYLNLGLTNTEKYVFLAKEYPQYLNDETVSGYYSMIARDCENVVKQYDNMDNFFLSYADCLAKGGLNVIAKDLLANLGLGQTLEEEWGEKNTLQFLKLLQSDVPVVYDALKKVTKRYADVKFVSSLIKTTDDEYIKWLRNDFVKKLCEGGVFTKAEATEFANQAIKDDEHILANAIKDVNYVIDVADVLIYTAQMIELEIDILETVRDNVSENSLLYKNISNIIDNIRKNPSKYGLEKYLSKGMIKFTVDSVSEIGKFSVVYKAVADNPLLDFDAFYSDLTSASAVVKTVIKLWYNYLYKGAKIDELYGAIVAYDFYKTIDTAFISKRNELYSCKLNNESVSSKLLSDYRFFYDARSKALLNYVEACAKIDKYKQDYPAKFADTIKNEDSIFNFDNYISFCFKQLQNDIASGKISCSHKYTYAVSVPETCTSYGYTQVYCAVCEELCSSVSDNPPKPHTYDNSCDNSCNVCGYIREITHTYDNDCDPVCNICGHERQVNHFFDNQCDTTCNICGYVRSVTHTFNDAWSSNEEKHWHTCTVCGVEKNNISSHIYDNSYDNICNVCGYERDVEILSGTCGDNATWYYNKSDATLTVSGIGAMQDLYAANTAPWQKYCGSIKSIIISDGITSIGNRMFYGCTNLKSVSFGKDITKIGVQAFYGCSALSSISIPENVVEIDSEAFTDCSSLCSISLSENVIRIGQCAFSNTAYYNNLSNWENELLYIGDCLIGRKYVCTALDYCIKYGTRLIADCAFNNGTLPNSISIPDSVKYIGQCYINEYTAIIGNPGSAAEKFAKEKNCPFLQMNTFTLVSLPTKTRYIRGEYIRNGTTVLDLSGLQGYVIDESGKLLKKVYGQSNSNYQDGVTWEIDDSTWSVGKHIITLQCMGYSASFEIEITENNITKITIDNPPKKQEFVEKCGFGYEYSGKYDISLKGMVFTIYYSDRPAQQYSYDSLDWQMRQNIFLSTPIPQKDWTTGSQTCNIEYMGITSENSFSVTIKENPVSSIEIISIPQFDLFSGYYYDGYGCKVKINYKDGSSKTVTFKEMASTGCYQVDGYDIITRCDTLNAGENSVSFSYMGAQADIKVYARDIPKIVSAKLVKSPKTLVNLTGAVIELEFEDGTIKQIEIFECFQTMFNPHQIDFVAVTSVGNIFITAENNCDCFGLTEFSINFNYFLNGNFYNLKAEKADGLDLNDAISAFQDLYCHSGGTSTCTERAKCSICGKEYGNFAHKLEYHARIEATYNSDGNIEYWSCSECGKLFGDLACKTEIQATDIVLPKITITESSFLDDEVTIISRSDIIPVGATFAVSKIVSDLQDVISYIDVKLIDRNGCEILNSDGDFLVKIKIPNEYERKKFKVLQENEDSNLTVIDAIYENGYISFNTNCSGKYMIIKANYVQGDINGDGILNNRDAARLLQYLAGWNVDYNIDALDVNGDGIVNNRDAARLLQYLAGWDVELF